jgi:tRNA A37 threonylcarbamoyltransferase TsaD
MFTGIDNAAMIAWTAILRIRANPGLLEGDGEGYDLPLRPKWSLEALYDDLD